LALIVAAIVVAILLFLVLVSFISDWRWWLIGGLGIFAGARWLVDYGRRLRAPDGWELMRRDPRPPVVFLRPFQEDSRWTYDNPIGKREGGDITPSAGRKRATREPKVARELSRIGPFVAVGRPGEKLSPLGAARIYVSDEQWQETVLSLVGRAAAVVLQPEVSPGTLWELHVIGRMVDTRRLLLLVPNPGVRPLGFARVRMLIEETLQVTLPPPGQCPPCDAFMFDPSGQPVPVVLQRRANLALQPFATQVLQLGITRKATA
jgi:hypothetical protein